MIDLTIKKKMDEQRKNRRRRLRTSASPGETKNEKKKHKNGRNTSLSLEVFARAGRSTYDKREVIKKRRAEMAAKINKFRRVVKKAGSYAEPTSGFDPEEYARKLTKMEDPLGYKAFVDSEDMKKYVGSKLLPMSKEGDENPPSENDEKDGEGDERVLLKGNQRREENENTNTNEEEDEKPEEHLRSKNPKKRCSAFEWKMIKSRPEQERLAKEREVREVKFQEEQKIRHTKRKERNRLRYNMLKLTSKGQPLMRTRVDAILAKLVSENK